jgi:predicted nucleic acid-binding protein
MIAVTDTSPLNYLIQIDEVGILPILCEAVLMPTAVFSELQHPKTPAKVRGWLSKRPDWLQLCTAISPPIPSHWSLGPGEREAIQISLERNLRTILIDETAGRKVIEELQLEAWGTLGILERGASLGLTSFRNALRKLEQTNFRMSHAVKEALLARNP